jgi:hypothetical protein
MKGGDASGSEAWRRRLKARNEESLNVGRWRNTPGNVKLKLDRRRGDEFSA